MTSWSLETLLDELHKSISEQLARARKTLGHPVAKGDASEGIWIKLLSEYLPKRYCVAKAYACDSLGNFSQQLDVVIYDRQYSPLIFKMGDDTIIPAESIYAVFEAKQDLKAARVTYAGSKAGSVRKLQRTSLAIPTATGQAPPKAPQHIIAGLLTLESGWSPPMGRALTKALTSLADDQKLDLGCIAAHGWFKRDGDEYAMIESTKAATAFLLELIAELQLKATVPMIDTRAYAKWLV